MKTQLVLFDISEPDRMIFLAGSDKSFRCDCGCNVFREIYPFDHLHYKCNSCNATYTGEK